MPAKKTHEQFLEDFNKVNKDAHVIGKYIDSKKPVLIRCLVDGHEWYATPNNLLRGTGCPKCFGKPKKTQKEFEYEMHTLDKNVEVVGEYVARNVKIKVRCLVDGHEWYATPNNLLNGTGCPKCFGGVKRTHSEFVESLQETNPSICVLGNYTGSNSKILVKCLVDNYEWEVVPQSILRGHGCPKCAGVLKKTHDQFVFDLVARNPNVIVLGEYVNSATKIQVSCKVDGHRWLTTPGDLMQGYGCPKCAKSGYDSSKPSWLYGYTFLDFFGFGITNSMDNRHKQHKTTFKKMNINAELLKIKEGDGLYIQQLENHLKRNLPIVNTGVNGFKTEAILYKDIELFYAEVERFSKNQVLFTH